MKVADIIATIEDIAPVALQEDFDNSGLITGNHEQSIKAVLITLDVTEAVIDEAIACEAQMIVSHHPVVLKSGFKQLTGKTSAERIIIKAIQNNIALYSAHTNLDMVFNGVSGMMSQKLGLINAKILEPVKNKLVKLVSFVPESALENVQKAIFDAGAGKIGNYDCCSFTVLGSGSFRAGNDANPYVGQKNQVHVEPEIRFETIMPEFLQKQVVEALVAAHPYEEVAYDLYPLNNQWTNTGLGMVGELPAAISEIDFLNELKKIFQVPIIRHTAFLNKSVKKIAVCGGSGSFLLNKAKQAGADVFITGDFKYHQFFDAEEKILIADIGHFESEQFTKELFFELLTKKFPNFAFHLSKINSNPIKYL